MRTIQLLTEGDETVRTQITLTKKIKEEVERRARKRGESMSEYLRKAAVAMIQEEDKEGKNLEDLANKVIGSIDMKTHPVWKSKTTIYKWSRKIREEF